LEEITSASGETIAVVIKKGFKKKGINFVSKDYYPLQLGINSYKKGDKIKPHSHIDREIIIKKLQEVVQIKNGKVAVDLYDSDNQLFKSIRLSTGDLIFFVGGGHSFEMLSNTTIIEVKQGPYLGKDKDKVIIK
jgi:hypothetical protein